MLAYFDEQIPSKTELDQEQEHHASKQHFDDVSDTSYSCICAILDLQFMMTGSEIQVAQMWKNKQNCCVLDITSSHEILQVNQQ